MALSRRICLAVPLVSLLAASTLWSSACAADHTTQIVRCSATTGDIVIEVYPEWAPLGAARFLELVKDGFFTNSPLFRVVPGFLVQFGIGETPEKTAKWKAKGKIKDDPNIGIPVNRGSLAFAGGGTNSRTTEMWIAFKDSKHLGKAPWETPFGQVVQGMEAVDKFYSGYGDIKAFKGNAPEQGRLYKEGIAYTKKEFPELSYINSCELDHEPRLSDAANAAGGAATVEKGSRKEAAGKGGMEALNKAAVPDAAGASVIAHQPHPEEDLRQLAISLSAPPAAQPSSVLSSTNGLLLVSAVVALVVGCVRFGGDRIIDRAGGGGILDKDR